MCYNGPERRAVEGDDESHRRAISSPEPKWSRDARHQVAIAVVTMFVALACLGAATAAIINTLQAVEDRQARVANCLLEQLTEHRIDSRYHNKNEAQNGAYPYPDPSGQVGPPSIAVDLKVCEEFRTPETKGR